MAFTTVRVYHDAILELADDVNDDLAKVMEDLAEDIRERAIENAQVILPRFPASGLDVVPGKDSRGLFFRIEMDGGSFSNYLTAKEEREHNWFLPAVEEVVGSHGIRGHRVV